MKLKHIAPYLPYELKIEPLYKNMGHMGGYNQRELSIDILYNYELKDIKPILRPLSDLTLEDCMANDISNATSVLCGQSCEYILKHTSYNDVETLISLHFDVFGLIEQGLAIDINTLEL